MPKNSKLLIGILLLSCLLLGIGYSAIQNITLDITGTATAVRVDQILKTGEDFNMLLKGATSTDTSDTKITRIVFDYWSDGYIEDENIIFTDSDWENGTPIDVEEKGGVRLFKTNDGTTCYILSEAPIYTNQYAFKMFQNFVSVTDIIFNNFNTRNVYRMDYMFNNVSSLKKIDLSNFNTGNVWTMTSMFDGVASIEELDLSSFDTRKVNNMQYMFRNMTSLTKLEISNFKTPKAFDMHEMFDNCNKLKSLDLSGFCYTGTNNVNAYKMFNGMSSLTYLDIRSFDFSMVNGYWHMFYSVPSEINIIVKDETAKQWLIDTFGTELGTIVLVSEL